MLRRWLRRRRATAAAPGGGDIDTARPIRTAAVPFRVPSLASATRAYAQAVDAGTFGRLDPRDLVRLHLAMGPEIWGWQHARRLTGQAPWRAAETVEARHERVRADRQMMADIGTWEAALAALDAETDRARLYGKPVPAPLTVPPAVMAAIEARRAATLERAARKRGQASDGGRSAPSPAPEGTAGPPSPAL